eukprot:g18197.t1
MEKQVHHKPHCGPVGRDDEGDKDSDDMEWWSAYSDPEKMEAVMAAVDRQTKSSKLASFAKTPSLALKSIGRRLSTIVAGNKSRGLGGTGLVGGRAPASGRNTVSLGSNPRPGAPLVFSPEEFPWSWDGVHFSIFGGGCEDIARKGVLPDELNALYDSIGMESLRPNKRLREVVNTHRPVNGWPARQGWRKEFDLPEFIIYNTQMSDKIPSGLSIDLNEAGLNVIIYAILAPESIKVLEWEYQMKKLRGGTEHQMANSGPVGETDVGSRVVEQEEGAEKVGQKAVGVECGAAGTSAAAQEVRGAETGCVQERDEASKAGADDSSMPNAPPAVQPEGTTAGIPGQQEGAGGAATVVPQEERGGSDGNNGNTPHLAPLTEDEHHRLLQLQQWRTFYHRGTSDRSLPFKQLPYFVGVENTGWPHFLTRWNGKPTLITNSSHHSTHYPEKFLKVSDSELGSSSEQAAAAGGSNSKVTLVKNEDAAPNNRVVEMGFDYRLFGYSLRMVCPRAAAQFSTGGKAMDEGNVNFGYMICRGNFS